MPPRTRASPRRGGRKPKKRNDLMTRTLPEWIGKTDDSKIPDRVRVRVFDVCEGRCHWSGRKIATGDAWDVDHVLALINGGQNRESNLAPILRSEHPSKTRHDIRKKVRQARVRKKHLGLQRPAQPMDGSRGSKWFKPLRGNAILRKG